MQWGLLTCSRSRNLGDDIQSLAVSRFLPRVDALVDRDRLEHAAALPPTRVVFNGWFLHSFSSWPPPANLRPVYLGFHAWRPRKLFSGGALDHFRRWAPIGCRDPDTVSAFRDRGIPAFWSGCPTLSLPPAIESNRNGIVFCDVSEELIQPLVERGLPKPWVRTSHRISANIRGNSVWKLREATRRLELYRHAELVITTRLHAALPCLAFGTPVIVIDSFEVETSSRWSGWRSLLPILSQTAVLKGSVSDWIAAGQRTSLPEEFTDIEQVIRSQLDRIFERRPA